MSQPPLPAPALPADYAPLLSALKERVRAAQYAALKAVNTELVGLYWDIGRVLVERQAGDTWGKGVVQQLATDLQLAFPGVSGFSASNLWRMRAFFEAYQGLEKLAPLVREVGWSHNLVILERCSDALQREFYLRLTRKLSDGEYRTSNVTCVALDEDALATPSTAPTDNKNA